MYEEGIRREGHWQEGRPETVNAQGIARTEELFLYFSDIAQAPDQAALVMQGLNDDTLRAIVEPAWVASSGVFGRIHPQDFENYPEEERLIDLMHTAPGRWVERLGFYGKWLHGDYATWNMKLDEQTVSTYRTLRKNHHTWPYDWAPFARSGDPRLLKFAETATRQMTDANFCHYASADVDQAVGPEHFRRQGWWLRSLLPWSGGGGPRRRTYTIDTDYIWHAYQMTGYSRARDMLLLLQRLMPHDESVASGPRTTCSMLASYIDMYNGTFDPYFLAAAWEISDLYDFLYARLGEVDYYTFAESYDYAGHGWRGEQQKWADFTRDPGHIRLALNNANAQNSPIRVGARLVGSTDGDGGASASMAAFGWDQTGDPYYLGRILAELDALRTSVYEGEIEYLRGTDGTTGRPRLSAHA
ncbi:MAG: hypothetical protein LC725_03005 [Lentisphaerae bacterium]|nr:hypothetical protein [Lentisphaerota bacterium]